MSASKSKNSDRILGVNEPRTQFWGVCCEGGKMYSQVVKQRFYITQAVLEPDPGIQKSDEEFVKVEMQRDGFAYLLCVLQHKAIYQVSLNYMFDKGEKVAFRIDGKGKVFLSGYQVADNKTAPDNKSVAPEGVQVSPSKVGKKPEGVFEVSSISPEKSEALQDNDKPPAKSSESAKSPSKSSAKKSPSKSFWAALVNGDGIDLNMDDDDDDEDDEDFSVGDEEEDDDDDDDEDEEDSLEDEVEEEEEDDDEEEEEESPKLTASGKRKQVQILQGDKKRLKKAASPKNSNGEDVVCIDDDSKEASDSDDSDSSIAKTPMPKKSQSVESKSAEKKKKKKKKSDKANISQKSPQTPQTKSPFSANKMSNAEKREGGVEVQDIRVGSGPVAKVGKMLHVYYVGKLADNTIFDSRARGQKPFSFKLGAKQVIKGWESGLVGMRVGGKRKLKVPPHMGYGSSHIEGIPPHSTLYFIVELEAVSS